MKYTVSIAILICILSLNSFAQVENSDALPKWCEAQWKIETSETDVVIVGNSGIVEKWLKHKEKCEGTVVYESRLAIAYALSGNFEKAEKVVKGINRKASSYIYLADFSKIAIDYLKLYASTNISDNSIRKLKNEFVAYVTKYPEFPDAFGLLGGIQTILGEHTEAIGSLERAKDSTMDQSGVYRNLTISYAEIGRYQDAISAANIALKLNKNITSDQYYLYALSRANAGIGDLKAAEMALRLIAAKKPEVKRDPEFKRAVDFVLAKQNEVAK